MRCLSRDIERVEGVMLECGAISVTLCDAAGHDLLEPSPGETPIWPEVVVTGLFESTADTRLIESALRETVDPRLASALETSELRDQEWSRTWMDRFRPMRYGERLWVSPSWQEPPDPDAVNLVLDPGLAFGTGTHATTGLCLRWLEAHPPLDKEVIDYGCGSGILAIAAIKLGARHCRAVDIDPQALKATSDNARRNGIEPERLSVHRAEELAHPPVDLLLANILATPLIELAPALTALLKPGGRIVLSGILAGQTDAVARAYRPSFELAEPVLSDGWALIEGSRHSEAP